MHKDHEQHFAEFQVRMEKEARRTDKHMKRLARYFTALAESVLDHEDRLRDRERDEDDEPDDEEDATN